MARPKIVLDENQKIYLKQIFDNVNLLKLSVTTEVPKRFNEKFNMNLSYDFLKKQNDIYLCENTASNINSNIFKNIYKLI